MTSWSQKTKQPDELQHESACEVSQERDKSYYGICFLLLKKRDILKRNSVWPVYAKIILALEYTSLPTAKGSLITNQSGSEQTFALTLVSLRYRASHTSLTSWTFTKTWYEYQYIDAQRHIQDILDEQWRKHKESNQYPQNLSYVLSYFMSGCKVEE